MGKGEPTWSYTDGGRSRRTSDTAALGAETHTLEVAV